MKATESSVRGRFRRRLSDVSYFSARRSNGCIVFRRVAAGQVKRGSRWARGIGGLAAACLFLVPLALMVLGSLRPVGLPPPRGLDLSAGVSAASYAQVSDSIDFARYSLNSLMVAALTVPLSVLFASWAGFAISRMSRKGAGALISISVAALMVPVTALLVGRFSVFKMLGVIDTWVPLVAFALIGMSPIYVLIYAWAFSRIPAELVDAARLEGLGTLGIWRRVGMPLVRPVTAGVATMAFVLSWGDFTSPLIYLFNERIYTLPLGLRELASLPSPMTPTMLAGAVMATLPVLIAMVVGQRWAVSRAR